MTETLPLFPLGSVLYPGLLLPLHIFEERYRQLVRDLLEAPEPRRFGVVAIREGRETGVDGVSALYEIGCTATVRRVLKRDGRPLRPGHHRRGPVPAHRRSTIPGRTCRARWTSSRRTPATRPSRSGP